MTNNITCNNNANIDINNMMDIINTRNGQLGFVMSFYRRYIYKDSTWVMNYS